MKNALKLIALLVLPWVTAGAQVQLSADSTLHPGDVVRVSVWRRPDFSGEFPIGPDGSILHPLLRSVHVAEEPIPEAENKLRQFLTQFETSPAFTFVPLQRIYIVGEVRQPNSLVVPVGTSIAQAIALAGGPTESAKLEDIELIRAGRRIALDFTRPDMSQTTLKVQSGDQIVVGRRQSFFRDYVGPVSAMVAGIAAVINVVIQVSR